MTAELSGAPPQSTAQTGSAAKDGHYRDHRQPPASSPPLPPPQQSVDPALPGRARQTTGMGVGMGVGGAATGPSTGTCDRSVSRRSSVVSTASSFFDRSFFSTPESRIVDMGKKTTLSYATLMLNFYNNISLDLKTATEANRRVVIQSVSSKGKAVQVCPDLSRVHADIEDAIDTVRTINETTEFESIKDLLRHSLQVYEGIKRSEPS